MRDTGRSWVCVCVCVYVSRALQWDLAFRRKQQGPSDALLCSRIRGARRPSTRAAFPRIHRFQATRVLTTSSCSERHLPEIRAPCFPPISFSERNNAERRAPQAFGRYQLLQVNEEPGSSFSPDEADRAPSSCLCIDPNQAGHICP